MTTAPIRAALNLLRHGATAKAIAHLKDTGASPAGLALLMAGETVEAVCVMEREAGTNGR